MALPQLNLSNHFVMCGWKGEMRSVVKEVLRANPQWKDSDIVIVAKVDKERLEELRQDPELQKIHIIEEEHFNENALRAACIEEASKIMVLADWSNKNESATETDAKTVMAAMTIEKIAPEVYMIAELLDPHFALYLKMAHVDEVIYAREYSRNVLANAVSSPGIAHVVYDLLDVHKSCGLYTVPIPPECVGRPFLELCQHFENNSSNGAICIGLLENTGNLHFLKRQALIEAQKSPEMRTVLKNLQHVKEIESNLPRINPGDDYIVHTNSLAVVVGHHSEQPQNPEAQGSGPTLKLVELAPHE
jgi:voltage-gated potassium channel